MADHLERLGLQRDNVDARIKFLSNRAKVHRRRAQTSEGVDDWQRTASWGAAAYCMAQGASLTMLAGSIDPAAELRQAAEAYLNAELPYGLIVESMSTGEGGIEDHRSSSLVEIWLGGIDRRFGKSRKEPMDDLPANLSAINQQLYLCMAAMSSARTARAYREPLKRMIDQMKPHPNVPHGPQSQPLHVQLDIIEPIFDAMAHSAYEGHDRAVNALKRLASHYAESIESAQHNQYLWSNLWSPIDYLDLEIVFAARCVARAFSNVNLPTIFDEDSIAAIPLLVAAGLDTRRRPRFPR
jgi:hypothetical protein